MDKYPETYEEFLSLNFQSKTSELEFYKHGYSALYNSLEAKNQVKYFYSAT